MWGRGNIANFHQEADVTWKFMVESASDPLRVPAWKHLHVSVKILI